MPHVDDGTLHAYLDGALHALADAGALQDDASVADVEAHLRTCADCRSRLEAERDVRERAGVVLRDARPAAVDVPPFELIAPATPAAARPRSLVPWLWAASVVLALGAGWVAGALLWQEPAVQDVARQESGRESPLATAEPPIEPSGAVQGARPAEDDVAVAGAQEGAAVDQAGAVVAQSGGAVAQTGRAVANAGAAVAPAATAVAAAAARQEAVADHVAVPDRAMEARTVAERPPVAPLGRLLTPPSRSAVPRRAAAEPERNVAAAPPPPPAAAAEPPLSPTPLDVFRSHLEEARAGRLTWLPLSPDDRTRRDAVLMLSGAETEGVEAAIASARLVRVQQRLDSGEMVQLLIWKPPVPMAALVPEPGTALRLAPRERSGAVVRERPQELEERSLGRGVRELILFDSGSGSYVAISGEVSAERLRQLAATLAEQR